MAAANIALFTLFLILAVALVANNCHAEIRKQSKNATSVVSLSDLRGARKGVKLQGLHQLKKYLHKFGYLNSLTDEEEFDDALEIALKTYQQKFRLNPTGSLDAETIAMMMMPRCGVPDMIINGTTTSTRHTEGGHNHGPESITTVSLFQIQGTKWKSMPVTYRFVTSMDSGTKSAITQAMSIWVDATNGQLSFQEVDSNEYISVGFFSGDHGDNYPFDGPSSAGGRVLAHGFYPSSGGDLHFDATENWSTAYPVPSGGVDIESVALHELGHTLGLEHSDAPGAIMGPYYYGGRAITLTSDDIQGIRYLYGS